MRKFSFLAALFAVSSLASASEVPVGLSANAIGDISAWFSGGGGQASFWSGTSDWGTFMAVCQVGSLCNTDVFVPSSYTAETFQCYPCSGGSFGNLTAQMLDGGFEINGSFIAPGTSIGGDEVSVNFAVTISGSVDGYAVIDEGSGYELGEWLFSVSMNGSGTGSFSGFSEGGVDYFNWASWSGTGMGEVIGNTPEPGSLGLLSLGFLALCLRIRSTHGNSGQPRLR